MSWHCDLTWTHSTSSRLLGRTCRHYALTLGCSEVASVGATSESNQMLRVRSAAPERPRVGAQYQLVPPRRGELALHNSQYLVAFRGCSKSDLGCVQVSWCYTLHRSSLREATQCSREAPARGGTPGDSHAPQRQCPQDHP